MQDIQKGAFLLWRWGDAQLEHSNLLRGELLGAEEKGFTRLLATLGVSRYGLMDRQVVRAAAQASQWARKRNFAFWFLADPRRSSRSLTLKTGERVQYLMVCKDLRRPYGPTNLCWSKVSGGRFGMRCAYRSIRPVPELQERALSFEPSDLERVFAFRMHEGFVLSDSLCDITAESHFFVDAVRGIVEVFGQTGALGKGDWRVLAFPRFDSNLYDYAGRQSNDALYGLAENLFDAGASPSGFAWGEGGFCGEPGRFPVSPSLYNSFIAELGYDLRDRLTGLVLPLDNGSHIPVRYDYHALLADTVRSAFVDFERTLHGFFGAVGSGLFHGWGDGAAPERMDPWRTLVPTSIGLVSLEGAGLDAADETAVSRVVIAKSLGVCVPSKTALLRLTPGRWSDRAAAYWCDLLCLFSVYWLMDPGEIEISDRIAGFGAGAPFTLPGWCERENQRIKKVEAVTGFRFPEADTLLVFPQETFMILGPDGAETMARRVHRFIGRLATAGVQLDVLSPSFLRFGKWSPDGFRIGLRTYRAVVAPYPEVVQPDTAELFREMDRRRFPLAYGGCSPSFTAGGKPLQEFRPHDFDPEAADLSPLARLGIRPALGTPKRSIGTVIHHLNETFVLLCPVSPGATFQGWVTYGDDRFEVPRSKRLVIYKLSGGSTQRML